MSTNMGNAQSSRSARRNPANVVARVGRKGRNDDSKDDSDPSLSLSKEQLSQLKDSLRKPGPASKRKPRESSVELLNEDMKEQRAKRKHAEGDEDDNLRDPNEPIKLNPDIAVEDDNNNNGSSKKRKRRERKRTRSGNNSNGKTIKTDKGPRAIRGSDNFYSKVTNILKKWTGETDKGTTEDFYLVQFEGINPLETFNTNRPSYKDFWVAASAMADCYSLIRDFHKKEEKKEQDKKIRRRSKPGYYYETNDIDNEPEEVDSKKDQSFRTRNRRPSSADKKDEGKKEGNETKQEGSSKESKDVVLSESSHISDEEKVGFDRGLEPEKVLGAVLSDNPDHPKTILYLIKFQDDNLCDYVTSKICKEKCPGLVIDYLLKHLQNVPTLSSSQIKRLTL